VLLIEPVKPDSQIGRLIAEQNKADNNAGISAGPKS
jgi:hypothetical protein